MKSTNVSQLSKNEQIVLYHLVKYPTLSDTDILEIIQMKQSTYSTIKKKLWREGYYYSMYTPIMQHLGCDLLAVWYITLNRKTRPVDRLAITGEKLLAATDLFTIVSEANQAVNISISKNIAEHIKVSDGFIQLYEENDFLEDIHVVLFPFEVSYIFSFFDFAPLLNRIFKIESPEMKVDRLVDVDLKKIKCKVKDVQMNELEKKVYLSLIRHPESPDSLLSENIGCSRQVFARLKYRFLEENMLKKHRLVSLEKLGFEILVMTHSKFNPSKPIHERQMHMRTITKLQTPIFHIARDPESVMLTVYKGFDDFKMLHNEYVSYCAENDSLGGEPIEILLSLPRIFNIKWLVYEPLVRKVLNMS
ncbi:MAG: hypothetical protein HZB92_07255 [Euryarchaeota archaeon]|nr:hypothetical protein [Euryarchaeota archaeon]